MSPGFGSGPFGSGSFGEWQWSEFAIVQGVPNVYREQDLLAGNGTLSALLEGLVPSFDYIRRKIRDYDNLRDPLLCPVDVDFSVSVIILRSDNQGDGTSVVFISEGPNGDKFKDLRPGMTITDFMGNRFSINSIHSSYLAKDVDDPPIDPATGLPTGRHVVVDNIGQGSAEVIPYASSNLITSENPVLAAFPLSPVGVDNGTNSPPYIFNVLASYVSGLNIAPNMVSISWTEGGTSKSGFFTANGVPGGDLSGVSTINRSAAAGVLAAGQIKIYNLTGDVIDSDSIRVTYTATPLVQVEDSEINAQNILAFLANDYGIELDKNDPEFFQRSYVNNAFKIWNQKGTVLGYDVLGKYAGYFVSASALYSISKEIAENFLSGSLAPYVYQLPYGDPAVGSITAIDPALILEGETFTLDDGINPPVTFEFDTDSAVVAGNVQVDISAALTSIDVANEIVIAINAAPALDLIATNASGTTFIVTIENTKIGVEGNVTSWSDTVADIGFGISQPTGGVDSVYFTTVNPGRPVLDDVALDAIPLDLFCAEPAYPSVNQSVTVTSSVQIRTEGSKKRCLVKVTAAAMEESFNTSGVFTDSLSNSFDVQNFQRLSSSSYQFETSDFAIPAVGAGVVEWNVLRFTAPNTITIVGVGTDVVDMGFQYSGYTGKRYKITKTFTDAPIISEIGNWAFIDNDGVISYIEKFQNLSGTTYSFEIISNTVPASGLANIFYYCGIVTSCDFCRSSSLLIKISPEEILSYPASLLGDAPSRLIARLQQMIPAHVRIVSFVYDPGPALAAWGPIGASSFITETPMDDGPYTAFYDEDEFPADEIPDDSAPILASSAITVTNLNVLEEYLEDEDPLVAGTWTATGLWHIVEYRSSTQFKSFNYGQGDSGIQGDPGAVAPNYDTGAISTGVLTSPSVAVAAATSVTLRFRHYGDMRAGANDDVNVFVVQDAGPVVVQTITKAALGLFATGSSGGWVTYSVPIGPAVIGIGNFHIEFSFNSVISTLGVTGEGWYIDDVEIKVVP